MIYNNIPKYVPHGERAGLAFDNFFDPLIISELNTFLQSIEVVDENGNFNEEVLPLNFLNQFYALVGKMNHENWEYDISAATSAKFANQESYDWKVTHQSCSTTPDVSSKLAAILILNNAVESYVYLDAVVEQQIPCVGGRMIVFPSSIKHKLVSNLKESTQFIIVDFVGPKFK